MPSESVAMARFDSRRDELPAALEPLLTRLNPTGEGEIVSDASRQRTVEVFGRPLSPAEVVETICEDVRNRGVEAVLHYTEKLDGKRFSADTLRVSAEQLESAHKAADGEFLESVRRIRKRVETFQKAICLRDVVVEPEKGVRLVQRYRPLRRVGICVPGGAAAYPSTVLMTAVPAQAAGVKQLAVVAPPTPFGSENRELLATCHELGIREVYRMGGAQAVAALAYGLEGIPAVVKIVGPGNLFVALAKRRVYGRVDIDSIAGPSEVVVIADDSNSPEETAADLIAQAEHAPGSSILITWSEKLLNETAAAITRQLANLDRGDLARESLEEFGALILVRNAEEATRLTDHIAPEHLHIAARNAELLLADIDHAGAAFLGDKTPVALGDYVAGPSHVLPTGGTARYASPLCANDFVRSTSVVAYEADALARDAVDLRRMADMEGLSAHRHSVDIRLSEDAP